MYDFENYVQDAIDIVGGWDLDNEAFAKAVNDQAKLMSGLDLSDFYETEPEYYLQLR